MGSTARHAACSFVLPAIGVRVRSLDGRHVRVEGCLCLMEVHLVRVFEVTV